jgi:hypothetical protein
MTRVFAVALVSLMVAACAGKPTPETTMRVYETSNTEKLKLDVTKTLSSLNYDTSKAEWKKTVNTTQTDKKTTKSVTERYSVSQPTADFSCFKTSAVELWTPEEGKPVTVVSLMNMDAKCYNSIGKVHMGISNDKAAYQAFFDGLTKLSGLPAKPISVSYIRR